MKCCASVGVCRGGGNSVADDGGRGVVCGVEGAGWAVNGRVLWSLLELAEASQSTSPSLDSAFDAHLSLLSAGCNSAASLLSAELHLFPSDVLLTNKQLSQQLTGRALRKQILEHTETLHSQLASSTPTPSTAPPSAALSTNSTLPALLSSIADLSTALPAFQHYHATHIAPHLPPPSTAPPPSAAPLAQSMSSMSTSRSAVIQAIAVQCDEERLAEVCDECIGMVGCSEGVDGMPAFYDNGSATSVARPLRGTVTTAAAF